MHVWLVTIGEPLPSDGPEERLLRAGLVASGLQARGHRVTWWTSAFDHMRKKSRADGDRVIEVAPGYRLHLLSGGGYRRNVSFQRLRDHRRISRAFERLARAEPIPDVILSSFPPIDLAAATVRYGRQRGVPVIVDVRDLWPDVFYSALPRWTHGIARMALRSTVREAQHACAGAAAIWGHAPYFVDWGLKHARRPWGEHDRWFPHGYVRENLPADAVAAAGQMWDAHGVTQDADMVVSFIGTVGHQYELGPVMAAARAVRDQAPGIRFVICGVGDRLEEVRRMAHGLDNVVFAGWRNRVEIASLLARSTVGVVPPVNRIDFVTTIPNKAPEYLSGGVPIALSLSSGLLHDLLVEHDCGFSYDAKPDTLAGTLVELREFPSRRDELAANARRLYETRFRADVIYARLIDALEGMADRAGGRDAWLANASK